MQFQKVRKLRKHIFFGLKKKSWFLDSNYTLFHVLGHSATTESKSHICPKQRCGKIYAQISHLNLHLKIDHKIPSNDLTTVQDEKAALGAQSHNKNMVS